MSDVRDKSPKFIVFEQDSAVSILLERADHDPLNGDIRYTETARGEHHKMIGLARTLNKTSP